ncbi:uncharacterized protein LOC109719140 [Ananas comosus]|uniref:Uncharacterized protein LOC109719140 n=1 Tax=Ananas comosus TaxID=4615 RepID=A0A6P5G7M8_ANACO|nr:uncharacterized protein LOC109719140 [Ananas comosus]
MMSASLPSATIRPSASLFFFHHPKLPQTAASSQKTHFLLLSTAAPNSWPLPTIPCLSSSSSSSLSPQEEEGKGKTERGGYEGTVEDLTVPQDWLVPSKALQESEWLRETLHKWLDDEYCPEPTNEEISRTAARSFYESLMAKQTDLGDILLKMVGELETLSYQQSFHGPFSSANAAVRLITLRMDSATRQ